MSYVYLIISTPHFELKVNHSILSELATETSLNDDDNNNNNNNNANLNLVRA
jgi:hypothetical protein